MTTFVVEFFLSFIYFYFFQITARRKSGTSDVLGHEESAPEVRDNSGMGRLLRQRVLEGQPEPALQHERFRGEANIH